MIRDVIKKTLAVVLALVILPLLALLFPNQKSDKVALFNTDSNKKITVEMRDYVIGARACEMPASFSLEALRAQACAIYTNAIRSKAAGEKYVNEVSPKNLSGYTDEKTLKQEWGKSFDTYYNKLKSAVDSVYKSVITYEGKPILAAYHSMSSGKTESAENVWGSAVPYLVSVESNGDTFCAEFEAEKTVSVQDAREIFKKELPETFLPQVDSLLITDVKKSDAGTVLSVIVGDKEVSGQKMRSLFALRSACFDFEIKDGDITFKTYGYGHGVGLSQYGADFMARQGKTYEEIIKHYYSGTEIMYSK